MKIRSKHIVSKSVDVAIWFATSLFLFRVIYLMITTDDYYLALFEDDFYYYFVTAKHIVLSGASTFDGMTITNGYHPLWMGILVLLTALSRSDQVFFILITIVLSLCFYLSARNLTYIVRSLFADSVLGNIAIMVALYLCWKLTAGGMETAILLPAISYLFLQLIIYRNAIYKRSLLSISWWSSICILARLDCSILITLIGLSIVIQHRRKWRTLVASIPWVILGFSPVIAYFIYNKVVYGHLMTVSSLSKQLPFTSAINEKVILDIWAMNDGKVALILLGLAVAMLIARRPLFSAIQFRYAIVAILFPCIYFTIFSFCSSWAVFYWYFYPFVLSNLVCVIIIGYSINPSVISALKEKLRIGIEISIIVVILVKLCLFVDKTSVHLYLDPHYIFIHTKKLVEFISSHPGRYAMGDRAGLVGYLSSSPITQIEGLAADFPMLDHITHSDDLIKVLHQYNIQYIIESVYEPLQKTNKGYYIESPHVKQAGVGSSKIKGYITSEPIFTYKATEKAIAAFKSATGILPEQSWTYIFKIQ